MRKPTRHQTTLAAYISAGKHLIFDERRAALGRDDPYRAKPIRQLAAETGMDTTTARYWLKRDHYEEWLRRWPTAEALWAEMQAEREANWPGSSPPISWPTVSTEDFAAADERIN